MRVQGHGESRENVEAGGGSPLRRATVEIARTRAPLEVVGEFVQVLGEPPVGRRPEIVTRGDGRSVERREHDRGEAIGLGALAGEV